MRAAVARAPQMVCTSGRLDGRVMAHFGERVFCKVGAEGVYCAALPELGLGVALNIDVIVPALEQALNASFLPRDIYLISRMPSDPQAGDIVPIALISLVLAFLATLYPSWRASRVNPAEALRHE